MKITINKPKKVFLFILSILAVIIISSILAYLTDKASKENEFTIGSVDIELLEPAWDALLDIDGNNIPDEAEALGPNQSIAKDPQVKNKGDNPAYVYLRVEVPKAVVKIDNEEQAKNQEIFSYQVHTDNWQVMDDLTIDDEDLDTVIYTYYYKNGARDYLEVNELSNTIFDSVILKNITDFNNMQLTRQIVVKAYAIQLGEELTVEANPWITQFENEKIPLPKMMLASFASSPANSTVGYQPGEPIVVSIPFTDEVTFDTAPVMTAQVGEGVPETLEFMPEETSKINKTLALTSRANDKKTYTVLKYKYTVKSGDEGEFKIVSFIGTVYSKNNREIKINVNNLPFTPETEEIDVSEKLPIQGQTTITSTPESLEDGYQPDEEIIIEIPFDDEIYGTNTKGAITESNAPILTAKVGEGTAKNLTYVIDVTGTKLKYKYIVQDGDLGEFQITNITGNIYSKAGTLLNLSLPTISESQKITIKEPAERSLCSQIGPENYGDYVNYTVTSNGIDIDKWRIFYNDGENVTIIAEDVIENSAIPKRNTETGNPGAGITKGTGTTAKPCLYRAYWNKSSYTRAKAVEKLITTNIWKDFVRSDIEGKATAMGGVTATTFVNSWNNYPGQTQTISIGGDESTGIGVAIGSIATANSTISSGTVSTTNKENDLYFPRKESFQDGTAMGSEVSDNGYSPEGKCLGYWLASPHGKTTSALVRVGYTGFTVKDIHYYNAANGIRPSVRLTSDIKGKYENGKWTIK